MMMLQSNKSSRMVVGGAGGKAQLHHRLLINFFFLCILVSSQLPSAIATDQHQEQHQQLLEEDYLSSRYSSSSNEHHQKQQQHDEQRQLSNSNHPHHDYSDYSCDHLYRYADKHDQSKQCAYASTCSGGDGIFAPIVYCSTNFTTKQLLWILTPVFIILVILLFRMVASTAEDFFCPALEMWSIQLGLPARFAGVTLLALGNGAPDIAATVNAIRADIKVGYLFGLGELTGSCMFVSTLVTGSVVVFANGVQCNGALLRDVIMLASVCALILYQFKFGNGVITTKQIHTWFWVYFAYVMIVLASDLYQRKWKQRRSTHHSEHLVEKGNSTHGKNTDDDEEEAVVPLSEATPLITSSASSAFRQQQSSSFQSDLGVTSVGSSRVEDMIQFVSNYNETEPSGWEAEETLEGEERLPVVHLQHGGLKYIPYQHHHRRHSHDHHEQQQGLQSHSSSKDSTNYNRKDRNDSGTITVDTTDLEQLKVGDYDDHDDNEEEEEEEDNVADSNRDDIFRIGTIEEVDSNVIDDDDSCSCNTAKYSSSWKDALREGKLELYEFLVEETWNDIYHDSNKSLFVKIFLTLELPFTIGRQLTVPIPCNGYYCRPILCMATAFSPFWFRLYLKIENDIDILYDIGEGGLRNGLLLFGLAFVLGLLILRYGPIGTGPMPAIISAPLAIYGFVVAATWVDLVADKLVDVLSFLGITFHIPGPIMGLSVLAVGNSIGDLAACGAVARKGLANMAITACFAAPVFNYLIGLGIGFTALQRMTKLEEIPVELPFSLEIGLVFSIINCLIIVIYGTCWGERGTLQKEYGIIALVVYVVYALLSLFY